MYMCIKQKVYLTNISKGTVYSNHQTFKLHNIDRQILFAFWSAYPQWVTIVSREFAGEFYVTRSKLHISTLQCGKYRRKAILLPWRVKWLRCENNFSHIGHSFSKILCWHDFNIQYMCPESEIGMFASLFYLVC